MVIPPHDPHPWLLAVVRGCYRRFTRPLYRLRPFGPPVTCSPTKAEQPKAVQRDDDRRALVPDHCERERDTAEKGRADHESNRKGRNARFGASLHARFAGKCRHVGDARRVGEVEHRVERIVDGHDGDVRRQVAGERRREVLGAEESLPEGSTGDHDVDVRTAPVLDGPPHGIAKSTDGPA